MSSHPPFRLRLTLALLVLAAAGTTVGAAVLLGSNQDDPAGTDAEEIAATGPPIAGGIPEATSTTVEVDDPGMRLGVLDKDEAIRIERRARADARALRALAAQQAAIFEYASAVDAAQQAAADTARPPLSNPAPPSGGDGGGGTVPPPSNGGSLYAKLDRIAVCESGQNPRAHNPQGPWWGAFQFHVDTWRGAGGGGGGTEQQRGQYILDRSYSEQREIAANLARARGSFDSWPTCGAGLTYP